MATMVLHLFVPVLALAGGGHSVLVCVVIKNKCCSLFYIGFALLADKVSPFFLPKY